MPFVLDLLGQLGLGGSVMVAATLGFGAFYLLKGVTIGRTVGSVLTNGVAYLVAILGAAALAIALGWVDPSIATAKAHVATAIEWLWSLTGGFVTDWIQGVDVL